jgi:tRNA pseudouridine55 synthase
VSSRGTPAPGPPEGVLLVDKPAGITSHDAVAAVRRRLGTKKVGHAGTLDPMATGLLVMGVGRATRLLRFLGDLPKTYEGVFRLGVETDTLDADGEVLRTATVSAGDDEIRAAAAALVGDSMQRPPAYSAVKVRGRRAYEAARAGESVEVVSRPIHVAAFDVERSSETDVRFRVVCSGGTYVRALAADVGASLGCGSHLTALRRTAIGPLSIADAVAPDAVGAPLPMSTAVGHLPRWTVDVHEAGAVGHGRILAPTGLDGPFGVYDEGGRLLGVYRDEGTKARPEVVLA